MADTGIYVISCSENGRFYVGSAVNIKKRWREHLRQLNGGVHHSKHMQRSWDKYGQEAFSFSVIETCEREVLIAREQHYIDEMRPEFNCSPAAGSQLGYKHSEESRRKMSLSRDRSFSPMKGRKHGPETIAKISENRRGKGCGPRSPEWRANIAASQAGRTITDEAKRKISAALTGRVQSAETIEKRVSKLRGRKMPPGFAEAAAERMRGAVMPEASILKMSKTKSRLTEQEVVSIRRRRQEGEKCKSLSIEYGIDAGSISEIARGLSYRWVP